MIISSFIVSSLEFISDKESHYYFFFSNIVIDHLVPNFNLIKFKKCGIEIIT